MYANLSKGAIGGGSARDAAPVPGRQKHMKTRARLLVGLLVSPLAASACGSRLGTGELEAANGVLTRHSTAAPAPGTPAGGDAAAAAPAGAEVGGGAAASPESV